MFDASLDLRDERDRKIAEMWLACYTEEEIAEAVGAPQQTVHDQVAELPKSDIWQKSVIFSNYTDSDWIPPLYDVWKAKEKSNNTSHFLRMRLVGCTMQLFS